MATQQAAPKATAEELKDALREAQNADTKVRLGAWRAVFEKTNRILSGKALRVNIVGDHDISSQMKQVPGWSDGEQINFNGPMVLDMLRTRDAIGAVLRLKGLNYHELSHCLFTPRNSEELPKRVIQKATETNDHSWWYAMNALEDQRIESWFCAMYGPSRRYFEAAVLQWLIDKGNAEAAVLIHGRKFLSGRIRVQAETVFVAKYGQDLYDRFKAVIDDYLTVVLPTDSVRAWMLVTKYHNLLKEMQALQGAGLPELVVMDNDVAHGHPGVTGSTGTSAKVGKASASDNKTAVVMVKKAKAKADLDDADARADMKAEAEAKAQGQQQGKGAQAGADSKGDKPGSGQGSGASDGGSDSGSDSGGSSSQGPGGDGAGGSGAGTDSASHSVDPNASLREAMDDLVREAEEGMDEIAEDSDVMDDVSRVLSAVKAIVNNGKMDASGRKIDMAGKTTPRTEDLVAQRRVRQVLTRIRSEVEPQVLRRQTAGRVDVRRVINQRPNENDIFTSYDEGLEDETGMEVVMIVDISGSMHGLMGEASAVMWVVKRAMDALGIRCTVIAYDTDHYIVYQPSERAKPKVSVISSRGGTDPTSALREAQIIFAKSNQKSKALVSVTDGQWGGDAKTQRGLMRAMHQSGVASMLLGLGGAQRAYGKHDHMVGHDLTSISELPKAVTKLVTTLMRNKIEQAS